MPKVPSRHRPLSFFYARNNIVVFFFIITHDLPDTIQTISQNRKIAVRFRVNLCLAMLSNCGLVILLFLVCFLCQVTSAIYTDIQLLASYQQDCKRWIMPCSPAPSAGCIDGDAAWTRVCKTYRMI